MIPRNTYGIFVESWKKEIFVKKKKKVKKDFKQTTQQLNQPLDWDGVWNTSWKRV